MYSLTFKKFQDVIGIQKSQKPFVYEFKHAISVTDGYHTMDELYDHRMALSAALFALIKDCPYDNIVVYKSKLHHDGTMFEGGYFVVGFVAENLGQISYHYKLEHWDKFRVDEYERAPYVYDGHTSKDVIERLLKL